MTGVLTCALPIYVRAQVEKIFATVVQILDVAKRDGILAGAAADAVAEARIAAAR